MSKKTENKFEVAGVTALICSITNPIQLVKYNSWYNNQSSLNTFNQILKINAFFDVLIIITIFTTSKFSTTTETTHIFQLLLLLQILLF